MATGRMEAFSDGVIAIIITIMVLELKVPHGGALKDLGPLLPVFLSYILSFLYVGIYWNNHHHMLHTCTTVTGAMLWANLHLLFWLSLFPFTTSWMGENHFAAFPTALYAAVLLMAAIAYLLLQQAIIHAQGHNSILKKAIGQDWKGKLSTGLYIVAIVAALRFPWIAQTFLVIAALIWLVPDRRIEKHLAASLAWRLNTQCSGLPLLNRIFPQPCHERLRYLVIASKNGECVARQKMEERKMKIVVIGGTGLIGSKLVNKLREYGHEAIPASPNSGVNTLTGEGLAEVLKGASVVVDVSNSPSFEETAATNFFRTGTGNLLRYEQAAGVRHHVALSVVGTEQLAQIRPSDGEKTIRGYFRAKLVQENLIKESPIPFSIVHATQFYEFVKSIADASTQGTTVRVAPVLIQPMAADDVASAVARAAVGAPVNGIVEVGGPEQFRLDEFVRQGLLGYNDPRTVVADPAAGYFGIEVDERSLVPGKDARLGDTRFEAWLAQNASMVPVH